MKYVSKEELHKALLAFSESRGYVLTKRSTKPNRILYRCDLGGLPRINLKVQDVKRRRVKYSRRINCPFLVSGNRVRDGWISEVICPDHNHGANDDLLAHSSARRLSEEDVSRICEMLKAGLAPKYIAAVIRAEGKLIKAKDVSNILISERRKSFEGRSATQALVDKLHRGEEWVSKYETDEEGHITRIFFTYAPCQLLSLRYHHVFLMDCTYKTNR